MSDDPDEILDEIEEKSIGETDDREAGDDMLLLIASGTASDNALRLLDRLQEDYGYGVMKEYASKHQSVYSITPAFEDGTDRE